MKVRSDNFASLTSSSCAVHNRFYVIELLAFCPVFCWAGCWLEASACLMCMAMSTLEPRILKIFLHWVGPRVFLEPKAERTNHGARICGPGLWLRSRRLGRLGSTARSLSREMTGRRSPSCTLHSSFQQCGDTRHMCTLRVRMGDTCPAHGAWHTARVAPPRTHDSISLTLRRSKGSSLWSGSGLRDYGKIPLGRPSRRNSIGRSSPVHWKAPHPLPAGRVPPSCSPFVFQQIA